jgi:hypothetical protein
VAYLDPRLLNTGNVLTSDTRIVGLSKWVMSGLFTWDVPRVRGLQATAFVRHASARPTDNQNQFYAPGYTTLDLGFQQLAHAWHHSFTFRLDVNNVTDEHYLTNIVPGGLNGYTGRAMPRRCWACRATCRPRWRWRCDPGVKRTCARRRVAGGAGGASPPAIADLWFAHNAVTTMLGAADRIRVTVVSPAAQPWLFRIAPALAYARIVANGSANAETLLADGVNVAFTSGEPEAARLRRFGLDARAMSFTDVAGFDRSLRETASVIGTPLARARLAAYERYTGTVVERLRGTFAALPEAPPARAASGLMVADEGRWRGHDDRPVDPPCGGRNAAVGLTGNQQPVSIEQVAAWHPDIIIVGGMARAPMTDPGPPSLP